MELLVFDVALGMQVHMLCSVQQNYSVQSLLAQTMCFCSDLPVPAITLISEGNLTAGENFTLSCSVTVIEGLVGDALVVGSWLDGRGNPVQGDSTQMDSVNTTLTLEFNPLLSSHGGRYTCNASITISSISTVKRNSAPYDITIRSKCSKGEDFTIDVNI